eukprot:4415566-Amphidinium_carterae.1
MLEFTHQSSIVEFNKLGKHVNLHFVTELSFLANYLRSQGTSRHPAQFPIPTMHKVSLCLRAQCLCSRVNGRYGAQTERRTRKRTG